MKINVLFFAELREIFGSRRLLELPEGSCAGEASRLLETSSGSLADGKWPLVYAVNENFENADTVLKEGDDLAILTPMSGG